MESRGKTALLVIDVQNDFCEDGSLPIKEGSKVVPVINALRKLPMFDFVIFSRDWHPECHCSFASSHPGKKVNETMILPNGVEQRLWPKHCVQRTKGSQFRSGLDVGPKDLIITKGIEIDYDSYSAFGSNGESTGLDQMLFHLGVKAVYCAGLAYDVCVRYTAEDAVEFGYKVFVIVDACRYVSEKLKREAEKAFAKAGIKKLSSSELLAK